MDQNKYTFLKQTSLEDGVVYNVYKNNTRLDDINYPSNPI